MKNFEIESLIYQVGFEQLKRKHDKFNFRCYICKDSARSARKKRGWILEQNGTYWYKCFNCGYSKPLSEFLKEYCYHIYLDYLKLVLTSFNKVIEKKQEKELPIIQLESLDLPRIIDLDSNHRARKYLSDRQISFKHFDNLYFSYNYQMYINQHIQKFENPVQEERIVIPIYNVHKKIVGVQGRSLNNYSIRYLTILFNDNELNVCGLERVDKNKRIYVTEGYFDSLFLDNAISMNSADIKLDRLLEISEKDNYVFVFDNEARNKEIKERMNKVIRSGFKIAIWPSNVKGKDINQMILNGMKKEEIHSIIDSNIYRGLTAECKLKMR
jgi:hypothetical protein